MTQTPPKNRILVFELDLFVLHDFVQYAESYDNVGVDDRSYLYSFIVLEAIRVDDAHLLDDGRFT